MDLKDRKILFELSRNARMPVNQLAKKVGLGQPGTAYRLKRLFDQKIIHSTYTIIDFSALGRYVYRVYFRFVSTTPEKEHEILDWVISQKAASVVGESTGHYDIVIMSIGQRSASEFADLLSQLKERYREFIADMDVSFYTGTLYFNRNYLLPEERDDTIIETGNANQVSHDELDLAILNSIVEDARKTVLTIAKETGHPARTVAYRLKLLEKNGIIKGYSINPASSALGREYYKLSVVFSKNTTRAQMIEFARSLDSTVYVDRTMSKYDFELNVEVKNYAELEDIIKKIKERFGGITEISIFSIIKFHKLSHL
ncbi:MAG: Lrp/AsnC family transcriptional regulator [Candidatus Woesearchaeota archaeon]